MDDITLGDGGLRQGMYLSTLLYNVKEAGEGVAAIPLAVALTCGTGKGL